jgi:hypothetical protein
MEQETSKQPGAPGVRQEEKQEALTPDVVARGGEKAVQVLQAEELQKLAAPFLDTLEELDKTSPDGHARLSDVWRQCMAFHSENAIMRANLAQMQVVLEAQLQEWVHMRQLVGERIEQLQPDDEDFDENIKLLLNFNESCVKTVGYIAKVVRDIKKEIRMTEFQSSHTMHLNIFQEFMTGLQGILWKHLHTTDKLGPIAAEVKRLAKMIRCQEV